jgi:SAM-dependent methyltransferase
MTVDWSSGRYESTAEMLHPAAAVVVGAAGMRAGLRVLDIGTGTGNAAILAAQGGADVIAIEPADRLRAVARERALSAGLEVDVRAGHAADMPVEEASIDVALSVFAVIFAPDPAAAAAEIARVLTPSGRLVMTAWMPVGAFAGVNRVAAQLAREALGAREPSAPFAWHENNAVADLFAPHGFTVESATHPILFTAESPEAAYDMSQDNPVAVSVRAALAAAGRSDQVERIRSEGISQLRQHNEDPAACRVTSHYALHVIGRR